jgi:hypothetical protein
MRTQMRYASAPCQHSGTCTDFIGVASACVRSTSTNARHRPASRRLTASNASMGVPACCRLRLFAVSPSIRDSMTPPYGGSLSGNRKGTAAVTATPWIRMPRER